VPAWTSASLGPLVALALLVAGTAGAVNNLPASVVLSGFLGPRALPAYAALVGLSVGALGTPHGSIATLIAFDRAGRRGVELGGRRYVSLWLPAAALATAASTACLWLLSSAL
jgi:Na+/H+ antiporter NhaD/arsenite permease-like protein